MPVAICYYYHSSHVLNLGRIPGQLAALGWQVQCYSSFPQASYPQPFDSDVHYAFDVPYAAMGQLSADLYLTPFVGQANCFPDGALRVHFLVSLTSLTDVYDEAYFDHYDVIACAGQYHVEEFAELGQRRGWTKTLLPVGYPKLDGQRRQLLDSPFAPPGDRPTVVFAPTHSYYVNSAYSVLREYGPQIIARLVEDDIRVIFRPHPESWRDQDAPIVREIIARYEGTPLFVLDQSANYFASYAHSDVMLTDVSGTGFTFAFTFGRPAVYFAPNAAIEQGKHGLQYERRHDIGYVVRDLDELASRVRAAHDETARFQTRIEELRTELLFHPGGSEEYFVTLAPALVSEHRSLSQSA